MAYSLLLPIKFKKCCVSNFWVLMFAFRNQSLNSNFIVNQYDGNLQVQKYNC